MFQKVVHYTKKIMQLGPRKSLQILHNKLGHKYFSIIWRRKALQRTAAHSWSAIVNKHGAPDFEQFFAQTKECKLILSKIRSNGSIQFAQKLRKSLTTNGINNFFT